MNGVYQLLQNLQKGCHSKGILIKIAFDMDIVIFGREKNFFEKWWSISILKTILYKHVLHLSLSIHVIFTWLFQSDKERPLHTLLPCSCNGPELQVLTRVFVEPGSWYHQNQIHTCQWRSHRDWATIYSWLFCSLKHQAECSLVYLQKVKAHSEQLTTSFENIGRNVYNIK